MCRLVNRGYRVIAPNQRGYSAGTVNSSLGQFYLSALAEDIFLLLDYFNVKDFHLVGHDWGASVGWSMVSFKPQRIVSWSALSIPHSIALQSAIARNKDQRCRSRYMSLFRCPRLAAHQLSSNDYAALKKIWQSHNEKQIESYLSVFSQHRILESALTWYEANLTRDATQTPIDAGCGN